MVTSLGLFVVGLTRALSIVDGTSNGDTLIWTRITDTAQATRLSSSLDVQERKVQGENITMMQTRSPRPRSARGYADMTSSDQMTRATKPLLPSEMLFRVKSFRNFQILEMYWRVVVSWSGPRVIPLLAFQSATFIESGRSHGKCTA